MAFKETFGDKVTTIIDCFEIEIEESAFLKASAQSWSRYKHAHTIKYSLGLAPQGAVMFISKVYAGRCSDKFVAEKCGFLDHLQVGDVVLADRGFLISASVRKQGASLNLPAFTKGKWFILWKLKTPDE